MAEIFRTYPERISEQSKTAIVTEKIVEALRENTDPKRITQTVFNYWAANRVASALELKGVKGLLVKIAIATVLKSSQDKAIELSLRMTNPAARIYRDINH